MSVPSRRLAPVLALALLVPLVSACGETAGGAKSPLALKNPFPEREKLAALAGRPATLPAAATTKRAAVATWTVDPSDVPEEATAAETRLLGVAGPTLALRPTRALRCAARELARFHLEQGAEADQRVERWVLGLCGQMGAEVSTSVATLNVPANVKDADLLARWQPSISPELKGAQVGAAMVRNKTKATFFAVVARSNPPLEVSSPDEAGRVTVTGAIVDPRANVKDVEAWITRGEHGVARCERAALPLPQVSFACVMDKSDETAWIEVFAQENERLLARDAGHALVRKKSGPHAVARSSREPRPAKDAAAFRDAVLGFVNEARAAASLKPLAHAAKESETASAVARHYFQAEISGDSKTTDLVALGLLAGWDVEGTIRQGDFMSALVAGSEDASRWVDYALEMPLGRRVLLAPSARSLAVGPVTENGLLASVVSTYAFFESDDHTADVERVHAMLASARAAKRLPAHAKAAPSKVTRAIAAQVRATGQLEGSVERVAQAETDATGRSTRVWIAVTNDLAALRLPDELLRGDVVPVTIEVTHTKPRDAAWGVYVVYILAPAAGGGGATAQAATAGATL